KRQKLAGKFHFAVRESYSEDQILAAVRHLQTVLWRNRATLWEGSKIPERPLESFDPEKALDLLGYSCETDDSLGVHNTPSGSFEIAGLFEANLGLVRLSRQFAIEEML